MKKLLCALMAATMLLSLAGCEKSDKDSSSKDSSSASVVDSDSKDESSEDESSKETTEDENSIDDSSDLDSTSDIQSGLQGNVFQTENYKVEINDKWTLNESAGGVLDCTFNYTDIEDENEAATCFGIQTIDYAVNPEDMVDQMVATYNGLDGYNVTGTKAVKFNGNNAQEIMIEMESLGVNLIMRQTLISDGEKVYAINSTAVNSCYDEMISEIDDVLASFEFI